MQDRNNLSKLIVEDTKEQISFLINEKKNIVNEKDELGLYPIHECIDSLRFDLLPLFRNAGADMNAKTSLIFNFIAYRDTIFILFNKI